MTGGASEASEAVLGYTEFEPDAATLLAETLAPTAAETEIFAALLEGLGLRGHRPHGGPWPRPPRTPAS